MKRSTQIALGALPVLASVGSMVFAADGGDTESAISSLQASTIALVALGATAGFAVMTASLTPDIGMSIAKRWIKKGAK